MSAEAVRWALQIKGLTPSEKHVLTILAWHHVGKWCNPKQGSIAEEAGLTRMTVSRVLKRLEERGLICRIGGRGRGNSTNYLLHLAPENGSPGEPLRTTPAPHFRAEAATENVTSSAKNVTSFPGRSTPIKRVKEKIGIRSVRFAARATGGSSAPRSWTEE